jgi:hypothetical protein
LNKKDKEVPKIDQKGAFFRSKCYKTFYGRNLQMLMISLIKQVSLNKSSLLAKIIFQNTNKTTKLKWKLLTKVIREPSEEAWV